MDPTVSHLYIRTRRMPIHIDPENADVPVFERDAVPMTAESVRRAVDENNREREEIRAIGLSLPKVPYPDWVLTEDRSTQLDMLRDRQLLAGMADRWGFMRILAWLRNLAKDDGKDL